LKEELQKMIIILSITNSESDATMSWKKFKQEWKKEELEFKQDNENKELMRLNAEFFLNILFSNVLKTSINHQIFTSESYLKLYLRLILAICFNNNA